MKEAVTIVKRIPSHPTKAADGGDEFNVAESHGFSGKLSVGRAADQMCYLVERDRSLIGDQAVVEKRQIRVLIVGTVNFGFLRTNNHPSDLRKKWSFHRKGSPSITIRRSSAGRTSKLN